MAALILIAGLTLVVVIALGMPDDWDDWDDRYPWRMP